MENGKPETSVTHLNGDAAEVKNVDAHDTNNEEQTAEISQKTKADVDVCIIFYTRII